VDFALIVSAALMGLAGTPHCLAMCGAACTAVTGGRGAGARVVWFHFGRMASYALAGAVAAASVGALAALGQAVSVFRPLWTLLHVAALGLGMYLIWQGRQPGWMERLGRNRTSPAPAQSVPSGWQAMRGPAQSAVAGLAWAAWPCGLLQSALLVAALANRPASGALAMAAFAGASSVGLLAGRALWMGTAGGRDAALATTGWMVRLGGLALATASAWALGHGLWMRIWAWCTT
jgi:sulfite exporter TauE/SafE